ncbi:MAG TPA: hypothetical protein DCW29_23140, partial [Janthinobacterium sp.]|nr:hypothetical protein [Janthinobacterium sp.]
LAGCGAISGARALMGLDPAPVKPDWKTLLISAADDANGNSAVAVDVVLVKDKAVLESLQTMPAAKWFAMRADLRRTFPDAFTVYPYELVPTQSIRLEAAQFSGQRAWAAFVFANYAIPGEHRARLPLNGAGYVVQLGAQGFQVGAIGAGAAQ